MDQRPQFEEGAAKLAFVQNYIDCFVLPRMWNVEEAKEALAFFRTSSFGEHYLRFLETYDRIVRLVEFKDKRLAEAGHLSGISEYFVRNGYPIVPIGGDFRYEMKAPTSSCDVLFCFEVLEHIKDKNATRLDDIVLWNFSGARALFAEMHRVLSSAGTLVLTTPNAASLANVHRCLNGEPPWLFDLHVREFAIEQVITLAEQAGFESLHVDTMYACFFLQDRAPLLKRHFSDLGFSADRRGDIAFYIFRKRPVTVCET